MIWTYMLSLLALYYIYDGYLRVLQIIRACLNKRIVPYTVQFNIPLTVLVTVYNEERLIVEKIKNILSSAYKPHLIEVLIASDGSTDNTEKFVQAIGDARIKLYRTPQRAGKSITQNGAIEHAAGEVIIFTDAATRFDEKFLEEIILPFSDPDVGAVDGHLQFVKENENELSRSQGFYWSYELRLRELESMLGILAIGSGACLAVRKSLLKRIDASVGEDCIVPLDVVADGFRVIHAHRALAYDHMDNKADREIKTRSRMTARNWRGTWMRPTLLNPLRHPGYAFALWSHKIVRWLSPFFLMALMISAFVGASISHGYWWLVVIPAGIAIGAAVGLVAERFGFRLTGLGILHSFCIANWGFLIGVLKAVFGKPITTYR